METEWQNTFKLLNSFWLEIENLRFLNGGVLRNLNIYSFQKLYPVCWPMGSASTGRAPQQLTESPFKYLNNGHEKCYRKRE